jgi:hypothetical protein
VSEAARTRADDQKLLRELFSKVDAGAAESRRILTELDKMVAAPSAPRSAERTVPLWGAWLRGRVS